MPAVLKAMPNVGFSEVAEMEQSGGYVFMPVFYWTPSCPYVALPAGSDGAVCYGSAAIGRAVTAGERREDVWFTETLLLAVVVASFVPDARSGFAAICHNLAVELAWPCLANLPTLGWPELPFLGGTRTRF